jgi:hypothetical protein
MAASAVIFVTPFLRALVVPEKYAGTNSSIPSRNPFEKKAKGRQKVPSVGDFSGWGSDICC